MEMEKLTKKGYGVVPLTSLMKKHTLANILNWQTKYTVSQEPIGKLALYPCEEWKSPNFNPSGHVQNSSHKVKAKYYNNKTLSDVY